MKKYLSFLFAATLLVFCGACSDDDEPAINTDIVGEWHLTTWNQSSPADFDVYMEFLSDGRFNIYQKVETSLYVKYSGDYIASDSRLSGRYSDGVSWGSDYTYELSDDGNTLTMTSNTDNAEVSVYTKTPIPGQVRNVKKSRSAVLPNNFQRIL